MSSDIIAIDVLLEPDDRMLAASEAHNTRLRAAFPDGFALDAQHRPHITLLQCFIAAGDLAAVTAATSAVTRAANVTALPLTAIRYGYSPAPDMGVAGIWIEVTPALLQLQADIIAAARPFMVATAGIDAFTTGHGNPAFDAALIDYVSHFTTNNAGSHFGPHVSTGVATMAYIDAMLKEPFTPFAFAAAGAAIYQLGPYGTAARLLTQLDV